MKVSPSLLAANFADLRSELDMINESECDYLHLDVMDGVFVPNISFGFPVIRAISRVCRKPLDVHMMTVQPEKWINVVRDTGAEIMNVHYEGCTHLDSVVSQIHAAGMKAGVTVNPSTPVELLEDIIERLQLVLVMSVNPGFGGQKFIFNTLDKITRLRKLIERRNSHALIEVDGGVNAETAPLLANAGADILVAGSYVFKSPHPQAVISSLKSL